MFCGLLFSPQQSADFVVPGSALNPAGQAVQTDAALASENESAAHTPHAAEPATLLAVPAAQATHGPPSGPEYPGLHWHAVTFVFPADEFELAGHDIQEAVLVVSLYLPIAQAVHGPPNGPLYPWLHA